MLRRRTPLKARAPMKRRTGNTARKRAAFERTYGGDARVEWVKARECLVCGASPCENVHVKSGGKGRKADACWIVALCPAHHHELHQHGANTFEVKYRIDLQVQAMLTDIIWQRQNGGK